MINSDQTQHVLHSDAHIHCNYANGKHCLMLNDYHGDRYSMNLKDMKDEEKV